MSTSRTVRAPRGVELSCKGWPQEAALRMLMNNLDPEVAERPEDLVVYGGTGKAARSWDAFDVIVRELRDLEADETLLVQSGKAVGRFRTHADAPRVLIANSLLVPAWANWDEFRRLEAEGLTMYGQMTAGSWIYIGTQGILQGTYETFVAAGNTHFGGEWKGKWILSAGLGGMGGAQPLAATMAGAAFLGVEVDPARVKRRLETRYVDAATESLDEALDMVKKWTAAGEAKSVALIGNAAQIYPELVRRGVTPDFVTEQTSAHDPLSGYIPPDLDLDRGRRAARARPRELRAPRARRDGGGGARDAGDGARRRSRLRLRQQHPRAGAHRRGRRRLRHRGLRPGLHPAALLRRQGSLPLGRALGRPRGHPRDRRGGEGGVSPTTPPFIAGSTWPRSASPSRACPPASAGSATATGTASA